MRVCVCVFLTNAMLYNFHVESKLSKTKHTLLLSLLLWSSYALLLFISMMLILCIRFIKYILRQIYYYLSIIIIIIISHL